MLNQTRGSILAALAAASMACAGSTAKPTYETSQTETVTATVESIDQAKRVVTLRGESGIFSFVAGEDVKNLAQVKVGDQVKVAYIQSMLIEVKKSDGKAPEATVTSGTASSQPGEKPAGVVGQQTVITASIEAIDMKTLKVTVKGPLGNLRVIQAQDKDKLKNVQVGDMVVVTVTEAVGISVEAAPKK